jgi:hypothetical protein
MCFKTPVIIANTGYRKGLSRNVGCGKIAALFLHIPTSRGAVEIGFLLILILILIGRRLLPIYPHLAFRETFPTWKYLFTKPPSTGTMYNTGTAPIHQRTKLKFEPRGILHIFLLI